MTDKARREEIPIGSLSVEGFQMPNGEYRMSLTSTAEAVGLGVQNASDFLRSNAAKRLLGEDYTPQISVVEVEAGPDQGRGQTRIRSIPLTVVANYGCGNYPGAINKLWPW